jgi:hypothetical protein
VFIPLNFSSTKASWHSSSASPGSKSNTRVMLSNIDEKENLARMERGELYYAFTPELVAARRRCSQAVGRLNRAGELTRREIAQHWKECVGVEGSFAGGLELTSPAHLVQHHTVGS